MDSNSKLAAVVNTATIWLFIAFGVWVAGVAIFHAVT